MTFCENIFMDMPIPKGRFQQQKKYKKKWTACIFFYDEENLCEKNVYKEQRFRSGMYLVNFL